jgi:hypothetical protein
MEVRMFSSKKIGWVTLAVIMVILTACGGNSSTTPTADANLVYTQMWETVQVAQTQTALSNPSPTNTPEASPTLEATNTPLISNTPSGTQTGGATSTPKATKNPSGGTQPSCDNAQFVDDVTIPDGAVVPAGLPFVKTWRFKNLGPCTWTTSYRLVFSYMSDNGIGRITPPGPVAFPNQVAPGELMDISVTITAPTTADPYTMWFVMRNDKGFNIPLSSNTYEFWLSFNVQ